MASNVTMSRVGGGGGGGRRPSMVPSSRNMSFSTRRRPSKDPTATGLGGEKLGLTQKKTVVILDDEGNDVTPQSLLNVDQASVAKQSKLLAGASAAGSDSAAGTPTDIQSQYSLYQQSTTAAGTAGGVQSKPAWASTENSFRSSRDSITGEDFAEVGAAEPQATGLADIITKHGEQVEQLTEEDLGRDVDIVLRETETFWLLDMPAKCIEHDTDEYEQVKQQNERYDKLCKDRDGNDLYAEREMQTFDNGGRKHKVLETDAVLSVDGTCMATVWDMYESFQAALPSGEEKPEEDNQVLGEEPPEASRAQSPDDTASVAGSVVSHSVAGSAIVDAGGGGGVADASVARSVQASMAETDSVFAGSSIGAPGSLIASSVAVEADESVLKSESFARGLFIMERVVVQNIYHPKLALYRGLPVYPDVDYYVREATVDSDSMYQSMMPPGSAPDMPPTSAPGAPESREKAPSSRGTTITTSGPHLEKLWTFKCDLTKDYTVVCTSWNKKNPDLIAVGYGQVRYKEQAAGLVCCWSIKNIEWPERVYRLESGVTSVDFSTAHPNLLGVGTYDGAVCVFDVAAKTDKPVLENLDSAGKHTGAVWEAVWVERERVTGDDKGEILVSISADGRVTQWSVRKGFEHTELMKLKKVLQTKGQKKSSGGAESLINRFSSGMGLAFKGSDSNVYLAGTEDGHIHRCSCSYNEQFLATYQAHSGPVYKVTWSPFVDDVFLSASADWSMRLWHQDNQEPIITFQPSLRAVTDLSWCPYSSTIFGCTTEDAVQIFDMSVSVIDPIVTHTHLGGQLTAFAFANNSPCVLFGDTAGNLTVMKMYNLLPAHEEEDQSPEDAGAGLNSVIQTTLDRIRQTEEQRKLRENAAAVATN